MTAFELSRPASHRAGVPLSAKLAGFLALTKPRIIELLLVTTVPTMVVAGHRLPGLGLVVFTVVGGALAAGGANATNMVVDRDIDALMKRTAKRPLVTGVLNPTEALVFAVALELVAFAELWLTVNLLSATLALSATLFYVFVYTLWLKRSTSQNIVIGGAAGAVPVLVGWSAVTGSLGWAPTLLFLVIFVWTPPHFWALAIKYRDDYSAADVPMLPSVVSLRKTANQILTYSLIMVAVTLIFGAVAGLGPLYWSSATVLGALFVARAVQLLRAPEPTKAMKLFGYSITYLTVLFVSMAADSLIFR